MKAESAAYLQSEGEIRHIFEIASFDVKNIISHL